MSDDELERLRALVARTRSQEEPSFLRKISRVAKGLFTRPKKISLNRVDKPDEKRNDTKHAA